MTMASQAAGAKGRRTWGGTLLGALFALIGLWLAGGGAWLLTLGGSPYYLPAGLGCLVAAWLYLAARPLRGMQAYLLVFAATCIWALAEVGSDFWQLLPRIAGPAFFAVVAVIHALFVWGSRRAGLAAAGLAAVAARPAGYPVSASCRSSRRWRHRPPRARPAWRVFRVLPQAPGLAPCRTACAPAPGVPSHRRAAAARRRPPRRQGQAAAP